MSNIKSKRLMVMPAPNLPRLFTYQKYPELNISNTTNSLDGSFSHLKTLLRIHRGQNIKNRKKMIDEILKNQPE